MALTGNIEIFPLQEVLRLLARSGKNGCLRVDAGSVDGRVYLRQGSLTLATTSTDAELLNQLVASGIVDDQRVDRMTSDELVLTDMLTPGKSPSDLTDFVREHVVESLYRIRRPGTGRFEFLVDASSRFVTGQTFDTEVAVGEADRRAGEWGDIEQTISDMHLPVRMARELREDEVTVNAPTWRVLAVLEGGSSVVDIARMLGTTEFRTAREVAGLMRRGLVEIVPHPVAAPAPAPSTSWLERPLTEEAPSAPAAEERDPWAQDTPWSVEQPAERHEPSWAETGWSDEQSETDSEDGVETAAEPEQPAADNGGWWAEAMTSEPDPADTDEFLESVFSEVESTEQDDAEETGFSMGLLRRRRMGPASRDISDAG